jgi:DNA-binding response OmpR family regulator
MRILIVEDDELVANGLKQGLQQLGYTVDVAGSAEDADRCVQGESFDIALVDIALPKADGLHFIRQLRARGDHLPALILTASDSMDDTIRGWMPGPTTTCPSPTASRKSPPGFAP